MWGGVLLFVRSIMFAEYYDYVTYIQWCKPLVVPYDRQMQLLACYRQDADMAARDAFVQSQLLWIGESLYRHYRNSGHLMDLIQEANLQLLHLVDIYDPSKSKFRTYAEPVVLKQAETNLMNITHSATVTTNALKLSKRLRDVRDAYLAEGYSRHEALSLTAAYFVRTERDGDYNTLGDTARRAADDCTLGLIALSRSDLSLDAPIAGEEEEGCTLASFIGDDSASPERLALDNEALVFLKDAVKALSPKQRYVLVRSYGLYGYSQLRTVEIAEAMGVSRQRVNVILNDAIAKVKSYLSAKLMQN